MKLETARKLNKFHMEDIDALKEYFLERIEALRTELEGATGDNVLFLQGGIRELRKLLKIREYTVDTLKKG